ncbi:hypothetical protein CRYUN_Cryun36dG0080600 [Craigia yunnanensis]
MVLVLYDRETGKSSGFAFVTMSTVEDCNAVIENLDGRLGQRVLYDGETGRSWGYGFISYSTKSEMEAALQSLNGVELEGRAMRVSLAQGRHHKITIENVNSRSIGSNCQSLRGDGRRDHSDSIISHPE